MALVGPWRCAVRERIPDSPISTNEEARREEISAPHRTAFETRDLGKVHGDGASAVQALRGVSLTIRAGELIVLLGPSGIGKSTLLNTPDGIDRASAVEAVYEGQSLTGMTDRQLALYRRHHVGVIFQFYDLISRLG